MKKILFNIGIVFVVLGGVRAGASLNIQVGDTVTINGNIDGALATTGTVTYQTGSGYKSEGCYAGAFSVLATDHGPNGSGSDTILTFCTDVGANWIANQDVTYTALSFTDSAAKGVKPPWSVDPTAIQNAAFIYNTYFVGHTLDADHAAGIQLAIWKVLYDTVSGGGLSTTSFLSGNLQASGFGGGIGDAGTYLGDLVTARGNGSFVTYTATWLDPSVEDQGLIWTPGTPTGSTSPVPEPGTVLAGLLLLLPLGASAYRIVRRNSGIA